MTQNLPHVVLFTGSQTVNWRFNGWRKLFYRRDYNCVFTATTEPLPKQFVAFWLFLPAINEIGFLTGCQMHILAPEKG